MAEGLGGQDAASHRDKSAYRPDIDGLRALAVLPVLLFHLDSSIAPGGFVGVDIFFVISGYLIVGIIHREISQGSFSILKFYERRARRILPALIVVTLFALLAFAPLSTPSLYKELGQSVVATAFSMSNVLFFLKAGYFEGAALTKPLLHTWSLGVEEQFYLIIPPILLLLNSKRLRPGASLLLISAASLAWSVYRLETDPSAAYYLLPSRAWELGLGALLVFAPGVSPSRIAREFIGWASVLAIALSIALLNSTSKFPGLSAFPACLATAALIWCGQHGTTSISQILSSGPLRGIGLISYSLYLWHWPLFSLTRAASITPLEWPLQVVVVLVTFALAFLSWRFVERPFRSHSFDVGLTRVFQLSAAALAVCALGGLLIHLSDGLPSRLPVAAQQAARSVDDVNSFRTHCMNLAPTDVAAGNLCRVGVPSVRASFIVWGDSHAEALIAGIDAEARAHGSAGLNAAHTSCPPLLSTTFPPWVTDCVDYNRSVVGYIISHPEIRTVVLAARWATHAEGDHYGPEDSGPLMVLRDAKGVRMDGVGNHRAFEAGLEATVATLQAAGRRVVIVSAVPDIGYDVPWVLVRKIVLARAPVIGPTMAMYADRQVFVEDTFRRLGGRYRIDFISPASMLCSSGTCRIEDQGAALYFDDDHLSTRGSMYIRAIYKPIFENLRSG